LCTQALFHEAEIVEVRCTDTLLALDALLDEASASAGAEAGAAGDRSAVRDAVDRVRRLATALARVKEAATAADF
jgi:hypothetical protein